MPSFILYPLSFLVVLGIMIVVHEWATTPPPSCSRARGSVFRRLRTPPPWLSARGHGLPHQRHPSRRLRQDERRKTPMEASTGDPGEFMSHPRWHRFLIAIAGPFMNVALAVGLLTGLYAFHFEQPAYWTTRRPSDGLRMAAQRQGRHSARGRNFQH